MASPRQLAYKDSFIWSLQQVVSAIFDDCDGFTDRYVFPDLTTPVPLVITLSQEQWTTLYSVILTGADLAYPLQTAEVEALFLQTVNCPMNQFCAAMINCLENDPDVWAALQRLLADNGYTGGLGDPNQPLPESITGGDLLPAGYVCTDDKAFGMALAVVNSINDATTEVLQAIEILTNPVEIANEIGDNFPGIGALSSAGDIASWIQNSAQEAYELAWSTTVRDELACLLWCDFKFDCELSFDTIWDIYLGEAGVSPPAGVLLTDWLAWLIAIPFTASLSTVATVSLLGLLAMRYGGSFGDFQLGIQSLETVIDLAQDDSSSDWSTVCDPCVETWCQTFDFKASAGIFVPLEFEGTPSAAVWQSGLGWKMIFTDPDYTMLGEIPFSLRTITQVTIKVDWGTKQINDLITLYGRRVDDGNTILETEAPTTGFTEYILNWAGSAEYKAIPVWLAKTASGDSWLTEMTIRGEGTNPFGVDNC